MNDIKRREAWLQELKLLRKELIETKESKSKSAYPLRTMTKKTSGIAAKMYDDKRQEAKIQIFMLALLTFLFETMFFIGSYLLFRK